jgi:uncharacterized membrane protein
MPTWALWLLILGTIVVVLFFIFLFYLLRIIHKGFDDEM